MYGHSNKACCDCIQKETKLYLLYIRCFNAWVIIKLYISYRPTNLHKNYEVTQISLIMVQVASIRNVSGRMHNKSLTRKLLFCTTITTFYFIKVLKYVQSTYLHKFNAYVNIYTLRYRMSSIRHC